MTWNKFWIFVPAAQQDCAGGPGVSLITGLIITGLDWTGLES